MHVYEIRKLEKDGKVSTVRMVTAEPKSAKQAFKEYAETNPGIYTLYQIRKIGAYFTEKED